MRTSRSAVHGANRRQPEQSAAVSLSPPRNRFRFDRLPPEDQNFLDKRKKERQELEVRRTCRHIELYPSRACESVYSFPSSTGFETPAKPSLLYTDLQFLHFVRRPRCLVRSKKSAGEKSARLLPKGRRTKLSADEC